MAWCHKNPRHTPSNICTQLVDFQKFFVSSSCHLPTNAKKIRKTTREGLLAIIQQVAALHKGSAPLDLVARRAGYGNAKNLSFRKALKRATAWVDLLSKPNAVKLTELGKAQVGGSGNNAPDEVETTQQAHDMILRELTPTMKKAFHYLWSRGAACSRADLAKHLGYQSKAEEAFKKLVNRMKVKGVMDEDGKDGVCLADMIHQTSKQARKQTREPNHHTAGCGESSIPKGNPSTIGLSCNIKLVWIEYFIKRSLSFIYKLLSLYHMFRCMVVC